MILQQKEQLTPDTHLYAFSKPKNFDFKAGQATEMRLMKDGWKDKGRKFTFASLPEAEMLEFVIKSYPDHDGVTEQMAKMQPGGEVEIEEPLGAIVDNGPGVFIAAGAGITPFIPILEKHDAQGKMDCTLIFTNKTPEDIILREKWEAMVGLNTIFSVTEEDGEGVIHAVVDEAFLKKHIDQINGTFYICGPGGFVDDVRDALKRMGADADKIITEDGW
jgi:ferredoxin-NADP reductase